MRQEDASPARSHELASKFRNQNVLERTSCNLGLEANGKGDNQGDEYGPFVLSLPWLELT